MSRRTAPSPSAQEGKKQGPASSLPSPGGGGPGDGRGAGGEGALRKHAEVRASRSPRDIAAEVLATEAAAISGLLGQLDERFDRAVELLQGCSGRVVCTGMGKSGIIMKKVAATLASTGTPAFFLHPAEAVHGDLGMIVSGDVVLAASYSGTTEELLRLVPESFKEGALALGATRSRAVWTVILPAALPGIVTGILVALARVAGETAPLLFTSFNNAFFSTRLDQPISSLTVQVYTYAISPYEDWHRQAWAGATVLIAAILFFSLLARFVTRRLERMHRGTA